MQRKVLFTTLAMLAVLTMSSLMNSTVVVLAPEAAPDIGVAATMVGGFLTVVYVFAMFTGSATGTLIDRFGPIRVCQATVVSGGVGLALLTLSTPLAAAASAALIGCAYGPFNPASAHVLHGLTTPRWQPFVFSVKQTGVPLGGALAGAIAPALFIAFGWRGACLWVAAAGLVVVVMIEPLRGSFDRALTPSRFSWRVSLWQPLRLVLTHPQLRRYTSTAFLYAGCQASMGSFTVLYLTRNLGMSLVEAGIVFACMQIGGFAGRPLWGVIAGRGIPPRPMLTLLGLMLSTCIAGTAFMNDAWPAWAVYALMSALGITAFGWNGVMLSEVAGTAPPGEATRATGGMQFVMFSGVATFPLVFGLLVEWSGDFLVSFALLSIAGLVGTALVATMPRARQGAG